MLQDSTRNCSNGPTVGVALACYNGAEFIRQQILSILWQEDCVTHVYVRDDGSTDDTLRVVEAIRQAFPHRLTIVRDDHGPSGSAAQNFFRTLLAMRGEAYDFVALADQDDVWEGRKLARAIAMLHEHRGAGYSSNLIAVATHGKPALLRKDRPPVRFDHLFQTASAGCTYVVTAALFDLVTRKLAEQPVLKDIAHDILIYAVARSHGMRWVHDRAAHIYYRQHATNLVGSRKGLAGLVARWRLIRTGWYSAQTKMLRPFLRGSDVELRILQAVERASLADRIWLASRALHFRRRRREAIAFALSQFTS